MPGNSSQPVMEGRSPAQLPACSAALTQVCDLRGLPWSHRGDGPDGTAVLSSPPSYLDCPSRTLLPNERRPLSQGKPLGDPKLTNFIFAISRQRGADRRRGVQWGQRDKQCCQGGFPESGSWICLRAEGDAQMSRWQHRSSSRNGLRGTRGETRKSVPALSCPCVQGHPQAVATI